MIYGQYSLIACLSNNDLLKGELPYKNGNKKKQ